MSIQVILFSLFVIGAAVYFLRDPIGDRIADGLGWGDERKALINAARESGWSKTQPSRWGSGVRGESNGMVASFAYHGATKHQPAMLVTSLVFQSGVDLTMRRRPHLLETDWLNRPLFGSGRVREAALTDSLAPDFIVECSPGGQLFVDRLFADEHLISLLFRVLADEFDAVAVDKKGAHVWKKSRDSVTVYADMNRLEEMARLAFELLTRIHRAISPAR